MVLLGAEGQFEMLFPSAVYGGVDSGLSWLLELFLGFESLLGKGLGLFFLVKAGRVGDEMGGGSVGGEFGRAGVQRKAGMRHPGFSGLAGRRVSGVLSY